MYSLLKISQLECITLKQIHFKINSFLFLSRRSITSCEVFKKGFSPFFLQVFFCTYIAKCQAVSSFFILERANVSHRPLLQVMYIQRTIKKYIVWVGTSSFILPSNFAVKKWDTKAHSTLTHATTFLNSSFKYIHTVCR